VERIFTELYSCAAHPEGVAGGNSDWINQEWTVKVTDCTETGLVGQVMERSMDEREVHFFKELETRLGYQFDHIEWLDQALTHKSFIHQTNTPVKESNEVLEFLGMPFSTLW
jgi:hypothetical protein